MSKTSCMQSVLLTSRT